MNKISINGMIITSPETIHAYSRETGELEVYLDQLDNVTVSNTEDEQDVTGKNGAIIKKIKQNKAVEVQGEHAIWSGSLMSAQVGSNPVSNNETIVHRVDVLTLEDDNNGTVNTKFIPVGDIGNEIGYIYVRASNGDFISQQVYTQTSSQEDIDGGTKAVFKAEAIGDGDVWQISLPTTGEYKVEKGTQLIVTYDTKVNATTISNFSDIFGKTLDVWIDFLATDVCDRTYKVSLHMPRGQFSGNFDIAVSGEQVMQDFTITNLIDTCGSSNNKLWDFIVYEDADEKIA